jgi:hypothetical protein
MSAETNDLDTREEDKHRNEKTLREWEKTLIKENELKEEEADNERNKEGKT